MTTPCCLFASTLLIWFLILVILFPPLLLVLFLLFFLFFFLFFFFFSLFYCSTIITDCTTTYSSITTTNMTLVALLLPLLLRLLLLLFVILFHYYYLLHYYLFLHYFTTSIQTSSSSSCTVSPPFTTFSVFLVLIFLFFFLFILLLLLFLPLLSSPSSFTSFHKKGKMNESEFTWTHLSVPDVNSVNLDDYNIHVIASVLKQWLRDLPSPLMTFELYEEFLRAMGKLIIIPFNDSLLLLVSPEAPPAESQFQRRMLVFFLRSARQTGGDPRGVFCDRPAQQDTPQHTGAPHLPSGQVSDEIIINISCTAWSKTASISKKWVLK